jgi:hypothetical protein
MILMHMYSKYYGSAHAAVKRDQGIGRRVSNVASWKGQEQPWQVPSIVKLCQEWCDRGQVMTVSLFRAMNGANSSPWRQVMHLAHGAAALLGHDWRGETWRGKHFRYLTPSQGHVHGTLRHRIA